MSQWPNPLVPGFNPDPSVVLVDGTYYLATSTFEYLPGLPIYRSTDLVEWTHIGNVATRPEQVEVGDVLTGRRRLGADHPSPRRGLLPDRHHRDERARVRGVHGDRPRRTMERRHHDRRHRRYRPRPRLGRRRQRLRHLLGSGDLRRGPRQAPRHPAGARRPRGRQGHGGAALALVGHRPEVPRGAARLPAWRPLVPDDRRGRHRARPRRELRPRPVDRGALREPPGQPACSAPAAPRGRSRTPATPTSWTPRTAAPR